MMSLLLKATEFQGVQTDQVLNQSIPKMGICVKFLVSLMGSVIYSGEKAISTFPTPLSLIVQRLLLRIEEVGQKNRVDSYPFHEMV